MSNGFDRQFDVSRIGQASTGTTPSGTPKYGLAFDLGTADWKTHEQFRDFIRDMNQRIISSQIQILLSQIGEPIGLNPAQMMVNPELVDQERQRALNLQNSGQYVTNPELGAQDLNLGWKNLLGGLGPHNAMAVVNKGKHVAGTAITSTAGSRQEAEKVIPVVGTYASALDSFLSGDPDASWQTYRQKGGILPEDDFNNLDADTRTALITRASGVAKVDDFANMPGVKQFLDFMQFEYRTMATPFIMIGDNGAKDGLRGKIPVVNAIDPMWFDQSAFADAWRKSADMSLGNALVNAVIEPYAGEDRVDEWRKNNAAYQLASLGSEVAVTWYAAPEVLALQGASGLARFAGREALLNMRGKAFTAMSQSLANEPVTIGGIRGAVGVAYANRMRDGWDGLIDFADNHATHETARQKPFNDRDFNGQSAAAMVDWLAKKADKTQIDLTGLNLNYTNFRDLTRQLLFGDPKAIDDVLKLDNAIPAELAKYAPGTQTFLDAYHAGQTKLTEFTKEAEDLEKKRANGDNSPLHNWFLDRSIEEKTAELEDFRKTMGKYENYSQWFENAARKPTILSTGTSKSRLFHDNLYGTSHQIVRSARGLWMQRANVVQIHDVDSGVESIRRFFGQLDQQFNYVNPDAFDEFILNYVHAPSNLERANILHDLEEVHLVEGIKHHIQSKFGIDVDRTVLRKIILKINKEQNRVRREVKIGKKKVYDTAPSTRQRMQISPDEVRLVSENVEDETVTLMMKEAGKWKELEVPSGALEEKVRPVDPTQTPNYYAPLDVRRLRIQMEHDRDVLEASGRPEIFHDAAALDDFIEKWGVRWNAFWKPMQLFRLGWPQRVLMDENMRELAVLGLPQFGRYVGGSYMRAGYNAGLKMADFDRKIFNGISNALYKRKYGRNRFNIGPGPVAERMGRTDDPEVREATQNMTPSVPEEWVGNPNTKTLRTMGDHIGAWEEYQEATGFYDTWLAEQHKRPIEPSPSQTPIQRRAYGRGREILDNPPVKPKHPLHSIIDAWERATFQRANEFGHNEMLSRGKALDNGPMTFHPTSGRQDKSGWAVPLMHTQAPVPMFFDSTTTGLESWYKKHAELLASPNYRVHITPDERIYVARHFRQDDFKSARAMMELAETTMHNITRNLHYVLADANAVSPAMRQAYREFISVPRMRRQEAEAPYGAPVREHGPGTIMHGSDNPDLADSELLPRDEAPVASGRMVGPGLYFSTFEPASAGFGEHLYALKDVRDGRSLDIFNLDRIPSKAELKRIYSYLEENAQRHGLEPHDMAWARTYLEGVKEHPEFWERAYSRMDDANDSAHSFLDIMAHFEIESPRIQEALASYFEEIKGAGLLKHEAGFNTFASSSGKTYHTYVALRPENLVLKPLYVQEGWVPFEKWLTHPHSKEQIIPENQVIRTGTRNPLWRELHTNHAKMREANGDELKFRRQHEQDIMEALGLRYADHATDPATNPARGADWYYQDDPEAFNRLYDDANNLNEEFKRNKPAVAELMPSTADAREEAFLHQLDNRGYRTLYDILKRREAGDGYSVIKSSDGKEFVAPNAYEGHKGKLWRKLSSSQGAVEALSDGMGAATSLMRRMAMGYKTYSPPKLDNVALTAGTKENKAALEYFHQWSGLLNRQIAHSPIWSKLLDGWDDDKLVQWLDGTGDGARAKREVMHEFWNTELYVGEMRARLRHYLPNPKLWRILHKEQLDPSTLRREIREEDYPDIYAPDVEFLNKGQGAGRFLKWGIERMWYGLGTVPTDVLSRDPFFRAMYDTKMNSLYHATDSKWITPDLEEHFRTQSHDFAMQQVRKHLWDLTDQTNFSDALRFVAPFWGAQWEALTKWGKIISDRPETVARALNLQRSAYNNYQTIDEEGNPVHRDYLGYHPTDRIIMRLPDFMQSTKFGKALAYVGEVGFPIGSANTVLQGEKPFLPGPGPILTIPADKLLRAVDENTHGTKWSDSEVYQWLFPVGRPKHAGLTGALEQVVPGWSKRVMALNEGNEGIAYANLMTQVGREMTLEARQSGKPDPTPAEIEQQAKWVMGLRIFSGLVAPVQLEYRPKHQYLIDEWHKYQQTYGLDAFDSFLEKYGKAAAYYAQSGSSSLIPPTIKGSEEFGKHKGDIGNYPQWAGAMIDPLSYYDNYSPDVYYNQFETELGPGDSSTIRELLSQKDRFKEADVRTGWYQYRKDKATIDAEMQARGLTDLEGSDQKTLQLRLMKEAMFHTLSEKNPHWREDFDNFNNDIHTRIDELREWAPKAAYDNRPDILGARQYLLIRDQVTTALDQYHAMTNGVGSRSLQAVSDPYIKALRTWFYGQVFQLTQANPSFGEFYTRYLSSDTLEKGGDS